MELNDRLWHSPVISPDGTLIAGFHGERPLNDQKLPESIAVITAILGAPGYSVARPSPPESGRSGMTLIPAAA